MIRNIKYALVVAWFVWGCCVYIWYPEQIGTRRDPVTGDPLPVGDIARVAGIAAWLGMTLLAVLMWLKRPNLRRRR